MFSVEDEVRVLETQLKDILKSHLERDPCFISQSTSNQINIFIGHCNRFYSLSPEEQMQQFKSGKHSTVIPEINRMIDSDRQYFPLLCKVHEIRAEVAMRHYQFHVRGFDFTEPRYEQDTIINEASAREFFLTQTWEQIDRRFHEENMVRKPDAPESRELTKLLDRIAVKMSLGHAQRLRDYLVFGNTETRSLFPVQFKPFEASEGVAAM